MKIAFISDIHSNLHALIKVLEEMEKEGIDEIYCCGDIVGYNAFPSECVDLIRKKIKLSVKGNHDYATVTGNTSWFNEYGVAGVNYSRQMLSEGDMDFLKGLNKYEYLDIGNRRIYIAHGSPRDEMFEYVFPDKSEEDLFDMTRFIDADIIVLGHTHIPMKRKIGKKLILNPGSVGQPRDGNPDASFMVIDDNNVTFRRGKYDIRKAANAILEKGLPRFLAQRLYLGI
ncbi:MAG TPA: metallophosphoesterase [Thermoplasmatales archaeon]|nr:metallophosphoesterase [Thermoplasmatales archaeon]